MKEKSEKIKAVLNDLESQKKEKNPSTLPRRERPQPSYVSRRDFGDAFDEQEMRNEPKH